MQNYWNFSNYYQLHNIVQKNITSRYTLLQNFNSKQLYIWTTQQHHWNKSANLFSKRTRQKCIKLWKRYTCLTITHNFTKLFEILQNITKTELSFFTTCQQLYKILQNSTQLSNNVQNYTIPYTKLNNNTRRYTTPHNAYKYENNFKIHTLLVCANFYNFYTITQH